VVSRREEEKKSQREKASSEKKKEMVGCNACFRSFINLIIGAETSVRRSTYFAT